MTPRYRTAFSVPSGFAARVPDSAATSAKANPIPQRPVDTMRSHGTGNRELIRQTAQSGAAA